MASKQIRSEPMPPNKRKARVLTNLKIDEISAVTAGAGEGVKIVLMKRDRAAIEREPVFEPPVDDDESDADEINDTSGEPTRHSSTRNKRNKL
jgi:hypothetical protein